MPRLNEITIVALSIAAAFVVPMLIAIWLLYIILVVNEVWDCAHFWVYGEEVGERCFAKDLDAK